MSEIVSADALDAEGSHEAARPTPNDVVQNVVVLNDFTYVQGGASAIALREAVLLAEAGLNVTFLGACGPVSKELAQARLSVRCLDQGQLLDRSIAVAVNGIWNKEAARAMDAILAPLDPATTIVHLHGWTKALSVSPVMTAIRAGFPVVATLHDFFTACPNGAFYDYPSQMICARTPLGLSCVRARCDKRSYQHKLFRLGRSVAWRATGFPRSITDFIAPSHQTIEVLRPHLPADATFYRIGYAIEEERPQPVVVSANELLVFIGRLEEEKGVRQLAAAAAAEQRRVLFVGDGPLRAEIEAFPTSTVTGWKAADEIPALLENARCLVFPSLWYETYGLVVDEAASRGIPAIVSRTTAAAERVAHGQTGWTYDCRDPSSLRDAVRTVYAAIDIDSIGLRAYQSFWETTWSREKIARHLAGTYAEIIERRIRRQILT